jgi:choline-sulfatase
MARKHIVFFLSDQHNGDIAGFKGDPVVRTPNLDSLAERGTVFDNCYSSSPLCVPSRSSMLSGLLPIRTGIFNNFQCLPSDRVTFVHSLGAAGYESVLAGRMHFNGPDQRHGFEKRLVGDITPSYPGLTKLAYVFGNEFQGTHFPGPASIRMAGPGHSNVLQYDLDVTEASIRFIEERTDERPLFMTVGFYGPHCPYVAPKERYDYYYERLPDPEPISDEFRQNVHPAIRTWYANRNVESVSVEEIRKVRAAYYGMVEFLDGLIGNVIAAVDRTLGLENTLFIYGSDHGDNIGANGLFWKTNFYDGAARVPLVFSLPGMVPENRRVMAPNSLMDIGPTLIAFADGPELPRTDGEDLLPVLLGRQEPDRDRAVISQLADVKGDKPSAMIRKGRWKLVVHMGYETVQLFDLERDPDEKHDLGTDESHAEVREDLRRELLEQWDEHAVQKVFDESGLHDRIIRSWVRSTGLEGIEEWCGDIGNNYLVK